MFRTRDFILLFTAITFLVSAIGATLIVQSSTVGSVAAEVALDQQLAALGTSEYTAVVATREGLDRAARIEQMREKIAAAGFLSAPDQMSEDIEQDELDIASTTDDTTVLVGAPEQCPGYAPYLGFWDARNLSVVEGEGATLVVRAQQLSSGSSTETTLLQLPKRLSPGADQSCISSDVIGIANDGSLIRNDELSLYSVFSSGTRIGYALDGFPIYGTGSAPVDQCGGTVQNGQYRYELQAGGESIVNCFSAAPIRLP